MWERIVQCVALGQIQIALFLHFSYNSWKELSLFCFLIAVLWILIRPSLSLWIHKPSLLSRFAAISHKNTFPWDFSSFLPSKKWANKSVFYPKYHLSPTKSPFVFIHFPTPNSICNCIYFMKAVTNISSYNSIKYAGIIYGRWVFT